MQMFADESIWWLMALDKMLMLERPSSQILYTISELSSSSNNVCLLCLSCSMQVIAALRRNIEWKPIHLYISMVHGASLSDWNISKLYITWWCAVLSWVMTGDEWPAKSVRNTNGLREERDNQLSVSCLSHSCWFLLEIHHWSLVPQGGILSMGAVMI